MLNPKSLSLRLRLLRPWHHQNIWLFADWHPIAQRSAMGMFFCLCPHCRLFLGSAKASLLVHANSDRDGHRWLRYSIDRAYEAASRIRSAVSCYDGHLLGPSSDSLLVQPQPRWPPSSSGRNSLADRLRQYWRNHRHVRFPGQRCTALQTRLWYLHWLCMSERSSLLCLRCQRAGAEQDSGQGGYGSRVDGV